MQGVVYRMILKVVHVLIPGTCKHVTLNGKKNFADVIKLRILVWENYPKLCEWAWRNHKDIIYVKDKRVEVWKLRSDNGKEVRVLCFKDGERGHEPRNVGNL
jgi:uncharacterized pyridoxamine 5'-phosphate oxidase family protein